MPNLPEFLLARAAELEAVARAAELEAVARAAELEAVARAATPGPWRTSLHRRGDVWADRDPAGFDAFQVVTTQTALNPDLDEEDMANAAHIAAWDPARALAWCATIRAIVKLHRHEAKGPGPVLYDGSRDLNEGVFGCVICSCVDDDPGWHFTGGWCDTVRLHAAIWAAHPDFDPSWRV